MHMLHKHHIIPTHAGGTDDPSNIIYLTVEEHAEAHRILWETHGRKEDWLAWKGLSGQLGKEEILKELYRENGRRMGSIKGAIPWNKGKKMDEDFCNKVKIGASKRGPSKLKGRVSPTKGMKMPKTTEHRQKIADSLIGRHWYHNDELKQCAQLKEKDAMEWIRGRKKYY